MEERVLPDDLVIERMALASLLALALLERLRRQLYARAS
jgi:hypothetical protein